MSTRLLLALVGALLIVRLPSLVQPMGPDQGLYAYVGRAHPARRARLPRRVGSEAAGDSLRLRGAARRVLARRRRSRPRISRPRRSSRRCCGRSARALGGPVAGGAVGGALPAAVGSRASRATAACASARRRETFIALAVTGARWRLLALRCERCPGGATGAGAHAAGCAAGGRAAARRRRSR